MRAKYSVWGTTITFIILLVCFIIDISSDWKHESNGDKENTTKTPPIIINFTKLKLNSTTRLTEENYKRLSSFMTEMGTCLKMRDETVKERSRNLAFFTKVPKTGSTTIAMILHALSSKNPFSNREGQPMTMVNHKPELIEQSYIEIMKWFVKPPCPKIITAHWHYTDFRQWNLQQPMHFSIVRHPLQRAISQFHYTGRFENSANGNYIRQHNGTFWDCLEGVKFENVKCNYFLGEFQAYFCGLDRECEDASSVDAMRKALTNIERDYLIIGLLEEIETTFRLFEFKMPVYFEGVMSHLGERKNINPHAQAKPSRAQIERFNEKFANEINIYNFIRQKFDKDRINMEKVIKERSLITGQGEAN